MVTWLGPARFGSISGMFMMMNKPNILFICTDQQTADSITDPDIVCGLPNISWLRQNGVTFTNTFCCTPQCTASRGGILTGLYPHQTGVVTNTGAGCKNTAFPEGIGLGIEFKNAGEYFQDAGYKTAYFGKWHLGRESWTKGFDRYFTDEKKLTTETITEEFIPGTGSVDPVTTRLCCEYIAEKHNKPFILFSELINPHDCYFVPGIIPRGEEIYGDIDLESYKEIELRRNDGAHRHKPVFMEQDQGSQYNELSDADWKKYRAFYRHMLTLVDAQVGQMIDALRKKDLLDNTIIVFTSDHGDLETAHRMVYKGPFMYRELVNVPLIVTAPGIRPGISEAMINNIDILPTLIDLVGENINSQMAGKSFKPALDGEAEDHRDFVVVEYYCKQKWCNPCRMLSTKEFKYVRYRDGHEELYDQINDPLENCNLAGNADFLSVRDDLSARLDKWMIDTADTFEQMPVSDFNGQILLD
jgi:arylsulfatase A-like enzyme